MIPLKIIYREDTTFFNILFICLAFLSIINFILTRKIQSNVDLMFKTSQMENLLRFQEKKYDQLSESYRQSRRLIHDVKNHYFSVNVDCNRIPINDYDLCVVLGNILDNALDSTNRQKSDFYSLYLKLPFCNTSNFPEYISSITCSQGTLQNRISLEASTTRNVV